MTQVQAPVVVGAEKALGRPQRNRRPWRPARIRCTSRCS